MSVSEVMGVAQEVREGNAAMKTFHQIIRNLLREVSQPYPSNVLQIVPLD